METVAIYTRRKVYPNHVGQRLRDRQHRLTRKFKILGGKLRQLTRTINSFVDNISRKFEGFLISDK